MIVTNKFVFIHMFRTGGTSINSFFDGKMLGYHRPRSLIPKQYKHLPVVGNVRNPYDWYVDIYYHALNFNYPMKTPTFLNFVLDFKRYSFKESIKRLIDTSWMTSVDKEKSLSHFPRDYNWNKTLIDNIRKVDFEDYLNSKIGFFSWLFNYMYKDKGTTGSMTYCRLEHLKRDWSLFLKNKVADNFFPKLNSMYGVNSIIGKVREPRSKNHAKYYDDELIKLIQEKDKAYLDSFCS